MFYVHIEIMALQSKESRVLRYKENTHERNLLRGTLFFSALRSQILHIFPSIGKIVAKTQRPGKYVKHASRVAECRIYAICITVFMLYFNKISPWRMDMGNQNKNLHKAKTQKNDEFYTQISDSILKGLQ